jgi:hypothetical protein
MPIPKDKELYNKIKQLADIVYKHPSAYKSGFIVRMYKKNNGKYEDDDSEKKLKRWFKEKWRDVGHGDYPTYRPTKRINKHTPLTVDEIDEDNLKQQIKLKQKIKGSHNLPPFKKSI